MRIGSLFSGYGGLDIAVAAHYGASVAWHVEFDKHPSAILAHHWPDVPNYGDVTAVDWDTVPPVDILTGGFPCQDVSYAGLRKGVRPGTRSGLWEHFAYAIQTLRPRLVVIENVSGLLSADAHCDVEPCPWCVGDEPDGHMRALGAVLSDLAEIGFDAEWCSVRASDAGAPHRRERVFIVAADASRGQLAGAAVGADRLLVAGERGGDADGLTLLPTPTTVNTTSVKAQTGRDTSGPHRGGASFGLEDVAVLLPTPAVNDMGRGKTPEDWDDRTQSMRAKHGNGNGHGKSLEIEAQRLLPTPTAQAAKHGSTTDITANGYGSNLWDLPTLLPTPAARDHKDSIVEQSGSHRPGDVDSVPRAVRDMGADFGPYAAAIRRWEQVLGRPAPSPTEPGKDGRPRLSPAFVEWMMGLPDGHVTDTGIPRNAQLKALGNGVVPQQAALALSMLLPRLYGGEAGAVAVADDVRLLPTPTASLAGGEPAPWKPGVQWWRQSRATRNLAGIVTGNTPEWEGGST